MSRLFTLFGIVIALLLLITLIHSPWLSGVATSSFILMIMVVGLHLFSGNSGVLAFGHVAFVEIGAYTCGILTIPSIAKPALFPNLPYVLAHTTIPPQAGVLVGGMVAAVAAGILFYPLRRLNAQALSIVTLALLLIANIFFTNVRLSSSGGSVFRVPLVATLWNVAPWLLATLLIAFLFQRSRLGLRLRASREDEFAAESGGIDIGWTRLVAFVVSAAIMGVAGGLYALSIGSFSAADFFIDLTILLFAMMVVGGMRSLSGAVVGTAVISIVSNFFSKLQNGVSFGDLAFRVPSGTANVSIALCMIVVLLFRSEGLMRDLEVNAADLWSKFKSN